MIIPDVNLLLYAYDSASPFHAKVGAWWSACLSGSEPVGLPHAVIFGFVRIGTNRRAFENPMTPGEAASHVRSWLAQPCVEVLEPGLKHTEHVLELLETLGTAGNLVTDAQIAALTIAHDAVLHTADTDFMRFRSLQWFNPLTSLGNRSLKKSQPDNAK